MKDNGLQLIKEIQQNEQNIDPTNMIAPIHVHQVSKSSDHKR